MLVDNLVEYLVVLMVEMMDHKSVEQSVVAMAAMLVDNLVE